MRASEFVSEVKSHDFMAGHCHVMALALKQLHPDWQIRAHVGWDDDAADDTEYRVDHVYTVAPDGTAYDCRGRFDNEQQLVGPDTTGGVDTQYVNFGPEEIKQAMLRGELKRFTKQDLANAMQVATQAGKQDVSEAPAGYKEIEFVCVNPQFPDATDPALQKKMYRGLKQIDGVVPLWQEWGDYSEGQASLSAIYQGSKNRDKILSLAKQLGVEVDLEQAVSDDYVDRAMRGEHEGQQGLTERKQSPLEDFEGLQFRMVNDNGQLFVNAFDSTGGNELGHVTFDIGDGKELDPQNLYVKHKFRSQGIARLMYDFVKSKGYTIHRSWDQTDAGAGFWDKHRGEERVWEQDVAEGSENNNPIANKIFFARSNKAPKGWSYDHIGFITQDGKQIQMSGHKGNDVYVTKAVTDDPEFPKQNIKIVSLSKSVSVPTTNSVGAENCGTFVANVLQANGIKGIDTQKIYSVFKKPQKQGLTEGATVTRIDSNPITDFGPSLKAYKHTDDWSQSGIDTGDDSYWKNKNLKTNTTKGLFAGDPKRTALYATGNAHETRYVEFTQDGQPIVYFDRKDLPAMRSRKTYLTVFDASDFRQLPTGEWFSENPGKPIKQVPIGDPFKYIASQGWIVRVTDNLDKVFNQVKNMHKAGKIAQYGAEGMNESKQGVAEGKQPGQPVVDAILKVMPIAQEIWFHGSRATRSHRKNSDTDILVIVPDDLVGDQYLGAVRILQKLSTHFDNHDIQPTKAETNIHRIAQEEGRLLWSNKQAVAENFADGRNPQDKGDSKRHGINTKASVSSLRKTAKQGGRKGQLAHWLANMKSGRAKKKKTNETVIGTLHFPKLIIAVDDHAIDRTRTRGISPATIDQSLRKLNGIADQLGQMESSNTVWVYDVSNNIALGLRRTSSRDMRFTLKTVVADRPFDGTTPIIELTS